MHPDVPDLPKCRSGEVLSGELTWAFYTRSTVTARRPDESQPSSQAGVQFGVRSSRGSHRWATAMDDTGPCGHSVVSG